MSRPSSSEPQICLNDGGARRVARSTCAGSSGASHGAKIAQKVKKTTKTIPIAASGLRRARRGSEMALAAKVELRNDVGRNGAAFSRAVRIQDNFTARLKSCALPVSPRPGHAECSIRSARHSLPTATYWSVASLRARGSSRSRVKLFSHPLLKGIHVLFPAEEVSDQIICRDRASRF